MTASADALRGFIEVVWNARELAKFPEYVSREVRFHGPRGPSRTYDEYVAMATAFQRAFSDLHFAIERTASEGEMVGMHLVITGTNDGPFRGRPATNKSVRVVGRPWARVKDGKIVEFWQLFDELGMLGQLGHVPADLL